VRRFKRSAAEIIRAERDARLDLERHGHEALLERAWALRDSLTAYDAVYVALAEALGCKLLTCDRRLAHSPGQSRRVELVR
jgi:predicted nucleic acid-binding protein